MCWLVPEASMETNGLYFGMITLATLLLPISAVAWIVLAITGH
jgi:hypothetical protein